MVKSLIQPKIEEKLKGFEFKWNKNKAHIPKAFLDAYPDSETKVINKNNFFEFVS